MVPFTKNGLKDIESLRVQRVYTPKRKVMPDPPQLTVAQVQALLSGLPPDKWAIIDVKVKDSPRFVAILQSKEAALAFARVYGGVVLATTSASSGHS